MIDTELKRLAEAARDAETAFEIALGSTLIRPADNEASELDAAQTTPWAHLTPERVLALLDKVERAEKGGREALKRADDYDREAGEWKGRYTAAGYPDTLDGWIARAEKAEAEAALVKQSLTTAETRLAALEAELWRCKSAFTNAHICHNESLFRARKEALEEAAKVAEEEQGDGDTAEQFDDGWNGAAMAIAQAIRNLAKGG